MKSETSLANPLIRRRVDQMRAILACYNDDDDEGPEVSAGPEERLVVDGRGVGVLVGPRCVVRLARGSS